MVTTGGNIEMTLAEIYSRSRTGTFAELVRQTDIKTGEDKTRLRASGYTAEHTELEFRDCFQVDPTHIWYSPSISAPILYFNEETLATCLFPVPNFGKVTSVAQSYNEIQLREQQVSEGAYMGSVMHLPEAMRLEYIEKLAAKEPSLPGLYALFISIYKSVSYGFSTLTPETVEKILATKSPEEHATTARALEPLPEIMTVYRGGGSESTDYRHAYSWTLDPKVAMFFLSRFGDSAAYLAEGTVRKEHIFETITLHGELEVLLWPDSVHVKEVVALPGMELCEALLPSLMKPYQKARDRMLLLDFAQDDDAHGKAHQARVILLCLMLATLKGLPARGCKILAEAAIYHDTKRADAGPDPEHGKRSAEYYRENTDAPDPLVEQIIEYHCRPDEEGHTAIASLMAAANQKTAALAHLCYDVFKDADALDRVRFGTSNLDIRFLRTKEAKSLPLVARIFLGQVRI